MRTKMLLAMGALVVMGFAGSGASAHGECDGSGHRHTASGSCKDTDDHQINCGSEGQVPVAPGGVQIHVNQTSDGAEVEACSDEGPGNQHGRLMVQLSESQQGGRVILDSDPDQPFPAGWIIAQGSAKDGNKNGVYCASDAGDPPPNAGDGYSRTWTNPGPEEGAECVPEPPF